MKINMLLAVTLGLLASASCFAAAPAGAPAGTTGLCKDGSYYSGAEKKGACRGHKGVKDWYGDVAATAPAAKAAKTDTKNKAAPAVPVAAVAEKPAATSAPTKTAGVPPAGATGLCKDGSYYSGAEKKGACRGHKGVQDWYGAAPAAVTVAPTAKPSAPVVAAPMTTAPMATPAKPAAPVTAPAASAAPAAKIAPVPAASGPGMVWANMDSKVYHCSTSRWYGKTKKGEYMTEAEAVAKGLRPDHGKACQ